MTSTPPTDFIPSADIPTKGSQKAEMRLAIWCYLNEGEQVSSVVASTYDQEYPKHGTTQSIYLDKINGHLKLASKKLAAAYEAKGEGSKFVFKNVGTLHDKNGMLQVLDTWVDDWKTINEHLKSVNIDVSKIISGVTNDTTVTWKSAHIAYEEYAGHATIVPYQPTHDYTGLKRLATPKETSSV